VKSPNSAKKVFLIHPDRGFDPAPVSGSGFCVLLSPFGHCRRFGHALHLSSLRTPTFLSPFPQPGFAFRASRTGRASGRRGWLPYSRTSVSLGLCHGFLFPSCGTTKTLTPASVTSATGLPAYLAITSQRSASNHVMRPSIALHARYSVPDEFQTSPRMSRLVATSRRIEFVILRSASSLPVAPHPASQRRSYLQLRGHGLPRHGLPPCGYRAFTGALIAAQAGIHGQVPVATGL
jgi:hypothetical protein